MPGELPHNRPSTEAFCSTKNINRRVQCTRFFSAQGNTSWPAVVDGFCRVATLYHALVLTCCMPCYVLFCFNFVTWLAVTSSSLSSFCRMVGYLSDEASKVLAFLPLKDDSELVLCSGAPVRSCLSIVFGCSAHLI